MQWRRTIKGRKSHPQNTRTNYEQAKFSWQSSNQFRNATERTVAKSKAKYKHTESFTDLNADKPAKAEESFDEDSWERNNIFKLWQIIEHWFPASYLGFYFSTKLAGKPFGFRLVLKTWICFIFSRVFWFILHFWICFFLEIFFNHTTFLLGRLGVSEEWH